MSQPTAQPRPYEPRMARGFVLRQVMRVEGRKPRSVWWSGKKWGKLDAAEVYPSRQYAQMKLNWSLGQSEGRGIQTIKEARGTAERAGRKGRR